MITLFQQPATDTPVPTAPTPSPIIINSPDVIVNTPTPDLPTWAIPVIAGSFTLLGVIIAWLGAKYLQGKKERGEREKDRLKATIEWASIVLRETQVFLNWNLRQEANTMRLPLREAVRRVPEMMDKMTSAIGEPDLHAPESVASAARDLIGKSLVMALPFFDEETNAKHRLAYRQSRNKFVNSVRALEGRDPLPFDQTQEGTYTEKKESLFDSDGFMEAAVAKYKKELGDKSDESEQAEGDDEPETKNKKDRPEKAV